MNKHHLNDEEIQQVVLEPDTCAPETFLHLQGCSYCKARAANYQLIFSELTLLPGAVADPCLQLSVMKKIAVERTALNWPATSIGLISGLAIVAMAALAWIDPQVFSGAVHGLSANVSLLALFAAVMIAGFYGKLIYKKHAQQMQMLDKI